MTIDVTKAFAILDAIVYNLDNTPCVRAIDEMREEEALPGYVAEYQSSLEKISNLTSSRSTPVSDGSSSTLPDMENPIQPLAIKIEILFATTKLIDLSHVICTPYAINHLTHVIQHLNKECQSSPKKAMCDGFLQKIHATVQEVSQRTIYNDSIGGEIGATIKRHHEEIKPILDDFTKYPTRDIAEVYSRVECGKFCDESDRIKEGLNDLEDRFLAAICHNLLEYLNYLITNKANEILATIPDSTVRIDDLGAIADDL